ncbi:sulfur carrier protein ThiS [Intestinibacter bartlettii]|nr:sulfur carrier protein ThiS [Intestinibacter bartlettii]MBS7147254.1 sulfur carrier protein ThiS [Intestinibacter bartlettii]MCC2706582.1 sulfur carrier protein ThiS [Intestinibacter bartlettii]MCC2762031.1 sulfur carrier protein ThiS [Intestinibacter bartlettii]MDU2162298.1 sulfur carrier protein ThiS [Intestinibacter bartlettii]MDU4256518.1 sulfur carrier protein ThiS [Intestinibacter bartlettii]
MILNGKTVDLKEEISVEQLLKDYDLNPQKVVVEVNMEILDDEVYSTYLLKNEDTVEVISFVGGG